MERSKLWDRLADQPPGLERRPANSSQSTHHPALDECITTALQSACPAPCGPCPFAQRMDSERVPGTSPSHDGAGQEDAVVVSPVDQMTVNPRGIFECNIAINLARENIWREVGVLQESGTSAQDPGTSLPRTHASFGVTGATSWAHSAPDRCDAQGLSAGILASDIW